MPAMNSMPAMFLLCEISALVYLKYSVNKAEC